jgi:hypothetical protein
MDPSATKILTLKFKLQEMPYELEHWDLKNFPYIHFQLSLRASSGEGFQFLDYGTHTAITMSHADKMASARYSEKFGNSPPSGASKNDPSYDVENYTGFQDPQLAGEVKQMKAALLQILVKKIPSAQRQSFLQSWGHWIDRFPPGTFSFDSSPDSETSARIVPAAD